jgi:hypothetical protein
MRVMLVCGFFMGLPKSKAQIGWGRYWVVPTALGFGWCFACSALVCLCFCGGGLCLIWLPVRRLFVCGFMALAFP